MAKNRRRIEYVLFDPKLAPARPPIDPRRGFSSPDWLAGWRTGWLYRESLVELLIARSASEAAKLRPGLRAIPIGSLTTQQKRWVAEFKLKQRQKQEQEHHDKI
jgi:hypothetical protein